MGKVVKKIGGGLFGGLLGKKKKAAAEPTGPIITPLGMDGKPGQNWRKKRQSTLHASGLGAGSPVPTILSDKLGG